MKVRVFTFFALLVAAMASPTLVAAQQVTGKLGSANDAQRF
jgi:hypothetical protein